MQVTLIDQKPGAANCWHQLFYNSVVASGFLIPPRDSSQVGLEIEFSALCNLAAISYPLECFNGLVFKGMSSVLIPKR